MLCTWCGTCPDRSKAGNGNSCGKRRRGAGRAEQRLHRQFEPAIEQSYPEVCVCVCVRADCTKCKHGTQAPTQSFLQAPTSAIQAAFANVSSHTPDTVRALQTNSVGRGPGRLNVLAFLGVHVVFEMAGFGTLQPGGLDVLANFLTLS